MVRLNWTRQSILDIDSIAEYISNDSRKYAKIQIIRLRNKARQLIKTPESGRIVPEFEMNDIRELILGNYRIIYKIVSQEQIDILTVHHSARLLKPEVLKK